MEGRRILAVRAGALGDTILVLPALAALRRSVGPRGFLAFAGREPFVRLAESPDHATSVLSIDDGMFRACFDERVDDRELRAFLRTFDGVVAWGSLPLLQTKLEASVPLIETSPFPPEGIHAAEHLVASLGPLGIREPAPAPALFVPEASRAEAHAFLGRVGLLPGRFVAMHPSSGSSGKNWPLDRFAALAERIRRDERALLWVEGEADRAIVHELIARVPAPVARSLPLPLLAAVLSSAALYIGNDSGVSHLAAAVAAPTVALFGPTDPRSWAPLGATVVDFRESPERVWEKALESISAR